MNIKTYILSLTVFILSVITLTFSSPALAKEINIYDQPKADAKVIGTVDPSYGIIPIFTSKEGDWMKVGDPRNGNVGWIKSNELNSGGGPTVFTFTQKTTNGGKTPYTYETVQYGQPQKLTPEQIQAIQNMEAQQKAMQESVQKAMQYFMQNMNAFINQLPMVMPVIIMPSTNTPTSNSSGQTNVPPAAKTNQPAPAATSGK